MRPPLGQTKPKKTQVLDHEKKLAAELGGRATPNSGALASAKGDISLDNFLAESKETEYNSIVIKGKDLSKISREAREVGKTPLFIFTLYGIEGLAESEWVAMPKSAFIGIME